MPITLARPAASAQRGFTRLIKGPTLRERVKRELAQAQRRRLEALSAREYADAVVENCNATIGRLKHTLLNDDLAEDLGSMTAPTPGRRGRRAADGATGVERVSIALTPHDRQLLRLFGGSPFVRKALRDEQARREAQPPDKAQ